MELLVDPHLALAAGPTRQAGISGEVFGTKFKSWAGRNGGFAMIFRFLKRKLQLGVQLLEILVCFTEIRQENEHRHLLRNSDLSSPSKSSQLGSKLMENARFLWALPRKDRSCLKTAGRFMVKRFRSAHVLDSNLISGNFRLGMCCNTHRDSRRAGELNLKWWSWCDVFRIIG